MTGCGVDEKDEGGERGKNEFGEHEGRGLGYTLRRGIEKN
jgi:hypothetical protein